MCVDISFSFKVHEVDIEWEDWRVELAVHRVLNDFHWFIKDTLQQLNFENMLLHIKIAFLLAGKSIKE